MRNVAIPMKRKGPLPYLFAHGFGGGSESTSVSSARNRNYHFAREVGWACGGCGGGLGIRLGSRRIQLFLITSRVCQTVS